MSEVANLHHLINLVLSENQAGILSVRTTLRRPVEGLLNDRHVHTFSFLFKTGNLVSARLGDYQDKMVLEFIELIASVVKARWTPMRTQTITITDASLSVQSFAERIHNVTTMMLTPKNE